MAPNASLSQPPSTRATTTIALRIPNVVGQTVKDATNALTWTKLQIVQLPRRNTDAVPGTVVEQQPRAGTLLRAVKVETLWVATARRAINPAVSQVVGGLTKVPLRPQPPEYDDVNQPPKDVRVDVAIDPTRAPVNVPGRVVQQPTRVPDLYRYTPIQVAAALRKANLRRGQETREHSDSVPAGQVFRQHPAARTQTISGTEVSVWYSIGPHPRTDTLTVPSVVGHSLPRATRLLSGNGLQSGHIDTITAQGGRGTVVLQKPPAGTSAHRGDAVDLVISIALTRVTVPNVLRLTREDADAKLRAAGLGTGTVTHVTLPDVQAVIIRQSPDSGTPVDSGALVDLVENRIPEVRTVTVPDLLGMTLAAAESALRRDSLFLGAVLRPDTRPLDRIVRQTPSAGGQAFLGTTVDVMLGSDDSTVPLILVPDVLNLAVDSARTVLASAGFNSLAISSARDTLTSESVIVSQVPAGGEFANSAVIVRLVAGPTERPPDLVPELRGLHPDVARGAAQASRFQMVIADQQRGIRLSPRVVRQVPPVGSPRGADSTVSVTVAIPVVPPLAAAALGVGLVGAGAGSTIRRIRERGKRVRTPDPQGVSLEPELASTAPKLDVAPANGLIRASLALRLEVTEDRISTDAPDTLIKSWTPHDA